MKPKETAYYDLLEVPPSATPSQIRKAFRMKALHYHPDRNGNTKDATQAFQHLKAVYDILSNSDRREEYDRLGAPENLHSDDPSFDPDAVAAFFSRSKPVTKADIVAYEKEYRGGPDENEDLEAFYSRMAGDVRRAVQYIPYSDESDLVRFVAFWDAKLQDGTLENFTSWKTARKHLLKLGKGKERQISVDAEDVKSSIRKKKRASQKDDSMAELANLIQLRAEKGRAQFESWCDQVEAEEVKRTKRVNVRRNKPTSAKPAQDKKLKAARKIKKKASP